MSISGLTAASLTNFINLSASSGSSEISWKALGQSLTKGDLKTAQTLFGNYQQMITGSSALSSSSQFATDLGTLSTALTKGDLTTAQSAYQTVSNEMKNNPALTMANTVAATKLAVQWMDDLLSLGHSSASAGTYTVDPATFALSAAFGYNVTSNSADLTTSLLNAAYGTSGSANGSGSSTTSSSPANSSTGGSSSSSS